MIRKLMIFGAGLVVGCYMGEAYLKKKAKETEDDLCCKSLDEDDNDDLVYIPPKYRTNYFGNYKTKKVAEKELADLRSVICEDILSFGYVSMAAIREFFESEWVEERDPLYIFDDTEQVPQYTGVTKRDDGTYSIYVSMRIKEDK